MWRRLVSISLISVSALALSACGDGNPFDGDTEEDGTTPGTPLDPDPILGMPPVPGDASGRPADSIVQTEAYVRNLHGYVEEISYDADNDTFNVRGLAFDGANVYERDEAMRSATSGNRSPRIFASATTVEDGQSGAEIEQLDPYRAVYGQSESFIGNDPAVPRTSFAVVRTGAYRDYGFGGFLYARNGSVTVPDRDFLNESNSQAQFIGRYAGIRSFSDLENIEYTFGEVQVDIDFLDFDPNRGVRGSLTNRTAYDLDGNALRVTATSGGSGIYLPDMYFVLSDMPSLQDNGEFSGDLTSCRITCHADDPADRKGTYYGILAGDPLDPNDGGELVGILVMGSVETHEGREMNVLETGGFIGYRGNP